MFADRREAGRRLAEKLRHVTEENPLILGVPRGGVPVAREIYAALGGELDVIIPRKVGFPWHPELAAGAVTMEGGFILNQRLAENFGLTAADLRPQIQAAQAEIKHRMEVYRGQKPMPVIKDRTVIVADDGVATGFTIRAALKALREQEAAQLILALPVIPAEPYAELKKIVDQLIYLAIPADFLAVGQFYRDFSQLTDEQVLKLLQEKDTR